jgi:hypothetical protein
MLNAARHGIGRCASPARKHGPQAWPPNLAPKPGPISGSNDAEADALHVGVHQELARRAGEHAASHLQHAGVAPHLQRQITDCTASSIVSPSLCGPCVGLVRAQERLVRGRDDGGRQTQARLSADASLEVAEGSIVALLGPNGAGKTTTLNAIRRRTPWSPGTRQAAWLGSGSRGRFARAGPVNRASGPHGRTRAMTRIIAP